MHKDSFIRLAILEDIPELANIHKRSYSKEHLTSLLPLSDLEDYYAFFLENGNEIILYEDQNIMSFVLIVDYSSFDNTANPINNIGPRIRVIVKSPFRSMKWIIQKILKRSQQKSNCPVRILSLVTDVGQKGKGLGIQLVDECEKMLKNKGVENIGCSIRKSNKASNSLFVKRGYEIEYEASNTYHYVKGL